MEEKEVELKWWNFAQEVLLHLIFWFQWYQYHVDGNSVGMRRKGMDIDWLDGGQSLRVLANGSGFVFGWLLSGGGIWSAVGRTDSLAAPVKLGNGKMALPKIIDSFYYSSFSNTVFFLFFFFRL
jgi:hypothetical protein